MEAHFRGVRPRRNKVRSAERRQEVVQRGLVRQVDDCESQAPLVTVTVEEVVISHAGIEQVPRSDPRRIVIVILRSRRRYPKPRRPVLRRRTRDQWSGQRREDAPAEKPGLHLLVRAEAREIHWRCGVCCEGDSASHQAAVIAPIERHPRSAFPRLVLHVAGLLEVLVVVDAEHRSIAGAQPADLGLKIASRRVAHDGQDGEAMEIGHANARIEPADLRVVPSNRKEDRCVEQVAKVVAVVRVLPEVVSVNHEVSAESLLESRMEFITLISANRP